ncbi:MAG: GGDEF domain-containing protein [Dokdonella sp.]|nr:diguanylate cyclase [Dokdonella sp.]MCB1569621.1 diguanylate cyclase [Xanthomonadales bacterium]MCB1576763.1 diguanylate cyclase [Xanthomonadales bacterium]
MRSEIFILLAALCMAGAASAEPTARAPLDIADEGAPTFTVYSSREGLSDEIWSTIGFDAHGFVWAGSASTLARFDGYRWTPWPFAEARSLVRDMQTDNDGKLWVIFEREGLASYDGSRWSLYPASSKFHQRFSDIHRADGSADYWVSLDAGFWHLEAGQWRPDPGNATLQQGPAARIEQTDLLYGGPRQWMGTINDGLWYRPLGNRGSPAPWQRFEEPLFEGWHSTDLLRTRHGDEEELWVLSYGDGLARIRADGIRVWRAANGELPSEAIYSARATYSAAGRQTVWIASRAGLLRIIDDKVAVFDRRHGLPSDAVRGIKVQRSLDGTDLLWLATEGGIARAALTASQWQTVSLMGARENGIFGVLPETDANGKRRLWVGSSKEGLGLLQDGQWRHFSKANGSLPAEGVRQIWSLPGPDGQRWRLLSLMGGQLMRIDDALHFESIAVPWPLRPDEVASHAIARRFEGRVEFWFATLHSGIYRWRDGRWTQFMAAAVDADWSVIGLAEQVDAGGRSWLWAASNRGIARFDGDQWRLLAGKGALEGEGFRALTVMSDGSRSILWAASNRSGVVRYDVTDPRNAELVRDGRVPAPPDPTVYSILPDSKGRIYVCTNNGVQQLTPNSDGGYSERVFRRRDGLVHDECNTQAQAVDAEDRYWVGTLGGLSVFDPNIQAASRDTRPKPLHFTTGTVDGETSDLQGREEWRLPAGTRELQIEYTLLSGLREHESTYRSQLLGYDSEAGAWTHEHVRHFSGLDPGRYELVVEGRDFAGTASPPRSLKISIAAFWWQEPLVRAVLAGLMVLIAAALVLAYNRGLRARQRHLKREVADRTLEIRAANERLTQLSYQDPLTGVANRRRLMEALDAAIERSRERQLPVGLMVIDVDHFKQYNDQHGHLAGDAALRAIAQALQSVMREQDLVARFGGEEFACLLIDADIEVVAGCAERMRALVEALPPRTLGNRTQTVTISAGVLSRIPAAGERAADLLRGADQALYRAKHEGRNCVRRAVAADAAPDRG